MIGDEQQGMQRQKSQFFSLPNLEHPSNLSASTKMQTNLSTKKLYFAEVTNLSRQQIVKELQLLLSCVSTECVLVQEKQSINWFIPK
jgi:hypothetical protein